jgi:hypothetical protein
MADGTVRPRVGAPQSPSKGTTMVFAVIAFAVIWIALAFWPARVAGRKGHSFFGFFLLSLLFFPLALILAYVADDRTVRVA